ncbi:MAG: two-component system response regulator (stage 0 sporulation protein F) [Lysobacterales bacterium]|jgi:two-component system response regulator (stage 0 sporulation protein F)
MKSILIIEDDIAIAKALTIRMKTAGYKANMTHDAVTGLIMAKKVLPDLILLDVNLPGGNGFLLAERLMVQLPTATPIIFITASKDPDFLKMANDIGAAGYFEKPYDIKEVLEAIKKVVGE